MVVRCPLSHRMETEDIPPFARMEIVEMADKTSRAFPGHWEAKNASSAAPQSGLALNTALAPPYRCVNHPPPFSRRGVREGGRYVDPPGGSKWFLPNVSPLRWCNR